MDERPGFWEQVASTYTASEQGDAPERIVEYLADSGILHPKDCVLEVGCGPGTYSSIMASKVRILVCMDSSDTMLDRMTARMKENGLTNFERFRKDWNGYSPRKGYDVCISTLCTGSSSGSSLERIEATARRSCVVISWEDRGSDSLVGILSKNSDIDWGMPRDDPCEVERWLYSKGRDFAATSFRIDSDISEPLETAVRRMADRAVALDPGADAEDEARRILGPLSENGILRTRANGTLRLVHWNVG